MEIRDGEEGLASEHRETKIMVNLDLLKKAGKDPCVSVRQELVAMESSVVAAYVGYTRNAVALRAPCALALISGAPY